MLEWDIVSKDLECEQKALSEAKVVFGWIISQQYGEQLVLEHVRQTCLVRDSTNREDRLRRLYVAWRALEEISPTLFKCF
jgi:hypothetical protein